MKAFLAVLVCLLSSRAFAMIELKLELGLHSGQARDFTNAIKQNVDYNPSFTIVGNGGLDAMYISDGGFAIGGRYEALTTKEKSSFVRYQGADTTTDNTLTATRTSILLGYRFLQLPKFHLGLLGHYGVSQSMDYETLIAGSTYKYKGSMSPSYGAGIDSGFHFGRFMLGGELGYTQIKAKFTGTSGPLNGLGEITADLSGAYLKFNIGAGF